MKYIFSILFISLSLFIYNQYAFNSGGIDTLTENNIISISIGDVFIDLHSNNSFIQKEGVQQAYEKPLLYDLFVSSSCTNENIYLEASTNNSTVKWFDNEIDGTLIHEGNILYLQNESLLDSYWVEVENEFDILSRQKLELLFKNNFPPIELQTSLISLNSILINWEHLGADSLQLQYRKQGNTGWREIKDIYTNPYNLILFQNFFKTNTLYEYRIRFKCNNFWGEVSDVHTFYINENVLGVKKINLSETLHIIPNPNNGFFEIISNTETKIYIINQLGQIIYSNELNFENNYKLYIEGFSNGIYYLSIPGIDLIEKFSVY
jgi:hypothetical protein